MTSGKNCCRKMIYDKRKLMKTTTFNRTDHSVSLSMTCARIPWLERISWKRTDRTDILQNFFTQLSRRIIGHSRQAPKSFRNLPCICANLPYPILCKGLRRTSHRALECDPSAERATPQNLSKTLTMTRFRTAITAHQCTNQLLLAALYWLRHKHI